MRPRSAALASTMFWLGTVLWLALPVGALVVLGRTSDADRPQASPVTWAPIGHATQPTSEAITIRFDREPTRNLVTPASLSGTVQRVELPVGRRLATGDRVLLVDNVWRIATTIGPFPRPLQVDDVGLDVRALNDLLHMLDLPAGGGDHVTAATARGVAALARQIGARPTLVFDPAWMIFVPIDAAAVASTLVEPGLPVPSGAPIATLERRLTGARIAPGDAESGDTSNRAAPATAPASVQVDGRSLGTLPTGTALPTAIGPGPLLAALAPLVPADDDTPLDAVLVHPPPAGAVAVPSAAVYADATAATCVLWRDAHRRTRRTEVQVIDTMSDVAQITGMPLAARRVLVDPAARRRRPC